MPRCTQWGAAAVAAAVLAGAAAAQLVPETGAPQAPVMVETAPKKVLPPLPPIAAPQVPRAGKLPLIGPVTSARSGTLVATGTLPLPKAPLAGEVQALGSSVSLDLVRSSPLLPTELVPADDATLRLSGPALAIDHAAASAAALEAARKRRLQELVREEWSRLEMDELGNPVVRGKLLLLEPDEAVLLRARAHGYLVVSQLADPQLGVRVSELAVPRGLSASEALRRLRSFAPGAQADFDHVYQPAGGGLASSNAPVAQRRLGGRLLIGMIDGGVGAHVSLAGASIEQKGFAGAVQPTGHGTAVASLLVGRHGPFRGAAEGASLAVADVYGGSRAAGSSSTIVRALGWLVSKRPSVINISLVGPPNRLLAAGIKAVRARNIPIVAAVGNDGPASPPQYPASYRGVIAITGVDARGRALPEAGNATHIDFAAPGAQMAAARPGKGYARVRGTSFAAPLAAGRLAQLGSVHRLSVEARPGIGRVGRGIVCNSCRVDPARVRAE